MIRKDVVLLFLVSAAGLAQVPAPHPLFDGDAVHEIYLTFTQSNWYELLTANYENNEASGDIPYMEAAFQWNENHFDSVGVRFKGNSSYRGASTKKKPFHIKFNAFVSGQKISGLNGFVLSNGWSDPSMVRENSYYSLAAAAGLVAPRSNFAALYVNGEYWGLYVLGETVNGDFLKNHFGKADNSGNLYEGDMGATFAYLGADPAEYKKVWEKQSNEDIDDWSDLIEFTRVLNQTPVEQLRAALEPVLDVDSVLTALALDNLTVNLDSYVGMNQNFFVYKRPSDGRWVWIPWDPSLAFGALAQGVSTQDLPSLDLMWISIATTDGGGGGGGNPPPGGGGGGSPPGGNGNVNPLDAAAGTSSTRPLATLLWTVPEYKERYLQIYGQLVKRVLDKDALLARMNGLREMIRPWLDKDTQKLATMSDFDNAMTASMTSGGAGGGGTPPGQGGDPAQGGGGGGGAPGLQPFIEARLTSVATQLADKGAVTRMVLGAGATSLSFTQAAGAKSPAAQTVAITAQGAATVPFFTVAATTDSGGSWLTVTPSGGAVPGNISVSVSGSGLSAGTYTGTITIRSAGADSAVSVGVMFRVT
jgi:spore coat protein CotH